MKGFFKKQMEFMISGAIVWLPIIIIIAIGLWTFNSLEVIGDDIIKIFPFVKNLPPGSGFLLILLLIYFSGVLFKKTNARKFVAKIPVLGIFLGDKNGKIMNLEKLLKLQPCVFAYTPSCLSFGFILSEENVMLNGYASSFKLLNIYYPNVPTMVTGQTFLVRKEMVIKIGNSAGEIINLLLYSSRSPENISYWPWKEETFEEFEERAKTLGLNIKNDAPNE